MAGDTNSPDRQEAQVNVLEVKKGEAFFLFPKDKPIKYWHGGPHGNISEIPSHDIDTPKIHVQGIDGVFMPHFNGLMSLFPGDLDLLIEERDRVVMLTNDGPIDLVNGGEKTVTSKRVENDKYTELFSWTVPDSINADSGVRITISTPHFMASYTADSYDDSADTKYYHNAVDEDGRQIDSLILPQDPDFLRKIRVEIG